MSLAASKNVSLITAFYLRQNYKNLIDLNIPFDYTAYVTKKDYFFIRFNLL
jgi:hypothetical protein